MNASTKTPVGSYALDPVWYRVGRVVSIGRDGVRLRPLEGEGGSDWDAHPCFLRPATPNEVMSAKVKAANAAARRGR
ncbi:hypothetical protein [Streptomyces hesseae]|uniref:DUF1918 domain-containing protein n=1 Tax=Streptomyces hesseae TaxID=3075519 RepID=A0ABU2SQ24_9ACTN|nr:hypothetical protein [Streptomyces sp. DSM 40473]MDT0450858.1 hypothetical protein [Streptomyces sp. DSM 40473]